MVLQNYLHENSFCSVDEYFSLSESCCFVLPHKITCFLYPQLITCNINRLYLQLNKCIKSILSGAESTIKRLSLCVIACHIISFISVDLYRFRNPLGYKKWSHNHRVYKIMKTILVYLAPYKLFDVLR